MPPKKGGKKSKKKREQELAEQRAREEEERLAAEKAEQERLEKERKLREEELARKRAEEAKLMIENKERLAGETADFLHEKMLKDKKVVALEEAELKNAEWERFRECRVLPYGRQVEEVNTYITVLKDKEETSMEVNIQDCQNNEFIIQELESFWAAAIEKHDHSQAAVYIDFANQMREITLQKMDHVSAHLMQYADQYLNKKQEVQMCAAKENVKYGLWVNVARNPRTRGIEFADMSFSMDIPKPLALAYIAIQVAQVDFDNLTLPEDRKNEVSLGGILYVQLMGLPPPVKQCGNWILRPVNAVAGTVNRLAYPLTAGADGPMPASQAIPIKIKYKLPQNVLILDEIPKAGMWDPEEKKWSTDGVTDVKFDRESRMLTLSAAHLTAFTVLQPRILDFPFQSWRIRPCGTNQAVLDIRAARFLIQFEINEAGCRLLSPICAELDEVNNTTCSPVLLLKKLVSSGINLIPDEEDFENFGATPKVSELESQVAHDIGAMVSGFSVCSSKWNQSLGENHAMFRVVETLDWEGETTLDSEEWRSVLAQRIPIGEDVAGQNMCMFVQADETAEECNTDRLEEYPEEFYASLETLLERLISAEAKERLVEASPRFHETVRKMFTQMRLFSFC
eukprot:GFYU01006116.1.p1 GENE.GFYU01006116.1~~GFYU01006116.1.p1  ORF type:complete len:635 (-),score=137.82 GFYU01006116.1:88-1965(-)